MVTEPTAAISKAFKILQLFREHNIMTIAICEEELGIPRSTAHRLLVTLHDSGMIEQIRGGHYVLSLELLELGVLAPQYRTLNDRVGVDIESLAYRTGYRVVLGVLRDFEVLYLEAANGSLAQSQGARTRIGFRGPLHATSIGQIFLAFGDDPLLSHVMATGMKSFTESTIADQEDLRSRLEEIQADGYALSVDEFVPSIASLAVPIFGRTGKPTAALAIVGDSESILRQRTRLIADARLTARRIENGIGGMFRYRVRGNRSVVALA